MNKKKLREVDFGYQKVRPGRKAELVEEIFDSVSENYDIMNDLMSFGLHRLWKKMAVNSSKIRQDYKILDLAGGTGDISKLISKKINDSGMVVLSDINLKMLEAGRDKLIDEGISNVQFAQLDAHLLPFQKDSFDLIFISFGLRNFVNKNKALKSILDCLKPGAGLSILEFSKPKNEYFRELYDLYSFELIPKIGELVVKDDESYRYLAESIRMHPDQEELKSLMEEVGFTKCKYYDLTNGITAIHTGIKPFKDV